MEEILNHLFMIEGLKIPSSTSSMRYKGSVLPVKEIDRKLEVSYVLEGRVSRIGNDVRIIVRLINGLDEKLLWSKDYNLTMEATELFQTQSDVAQQVADNLKVAIDPEVKKRIESVPTSNTEAYTLYLQARNISGDVAYSRLDEVRSMLEKAISLDTCFADAYSGLAYYWLGQGGHGGSLDRAQVLEKAEPLVAKALLLDKNSLLSHIVNAMLRLWYNWDFESVEKEFKIIKQLDPSNTNATFFSDYMLASGKIKDAFTSVKSDFDLNMNIASSWTQMALVYFFNGQAEKALETLKTAQRLFPDNRYVLLNSARIFTYLEKYNDEIELFEEHLGNEKIKDIFPYFLGHLGVAYFKTGDKNKSEEFLSELISRSKISAVGSPSFFAAGIYTAMGDNEKAIQALEKGYEDHEVEMYWLKVEPLFRPLHGDPRFENLLNKIGFK